MLATFFLKLMIWMLKGIFSGTHLRTRDVLGASDVADVRHDSVPQSGHSGGGLSHTKGDDMAIIIIILMVIMMTF